MLGKAYGLANECNLSPTFTECFIEHLGTQLEYFHSGDIVRGRLNVVDSLFLKNRFLVAGVQDRCSTR